MIRMRCFFTLLTLCALLCGCRVQARAAAGDRVVTGVDILYRQNQDSLERHYTSSEKMQLVLNYLRLLEYAGIPNTDPEMYTGNVCRICLRLAGGGSRTYYLYADHFLSVDYRPWQQIVPDRSLVTVLHLMPDDP